MHLLPGLNGGGIERFLFRYIKYHQSKNFESEYEHLFVIHDKKEGIVEKLFLEMGFKILRIPAKSKKPIEFSIKLIKIINKHNVDIVHVHQNYSGWLAIIISKIKSKYVICHGHQYYLQQPLINRIHNSIVRPFINLSDYKIACTYESSNWLYKGKHDLILPYSMDIELFKYNVNYRAQIRNEFQLHDKKIIGHIGRMSKQKNQFFLLDIFKELLNSMPDLHLIFVGEGELELETKKYAETISNITWVEPREDIHKFYSAFDAFLLPSNWEGLGIVAIESQACGLPTVISENLPKDLNQSSLVYRLELNQKCEIWSQLLKKILNNLNQDRDSFNHQLQQTKYNIKYGVNNLFDIYENS